MLAVRLHAGDEAAAELAAYEAAAKLPTNELVSCDDVDHDTGTLDILDKKSGEWRRASATDSGGSVASYSLVSLIAFCFAFEDGPLTWPPRARVGVSRVSRNSFHPSVRQWMNPCRLLRARAVLRAIELVSRTASTALSA